MFTILGLLCIRLQTKHIASGLCFRYSQTNELFAGENLRDNLSLEAGVSEIQNGGKTDDFSAKETVTVTASITANKLLSND